MPTLQQKLATMDDWHAAYRALQDRANRITDRLVPMPAELAEHSGINPGVSVSEFCRRLDRCAVLGAQRAKYREVINILIARPAFRAVQARYDAVVLGKAA